MRSGGGTLGSSDTPTPAARISPRFYHLITKASFMDIIKTVVLAAAFVAAICRPSLAQTREELVDRVAELTRAHAIASKMPLKQTALYCHIFASMNGRFPGKPSDLRQLCDGAKWHALFATYDAELIETGRKLEDRDKLWDWIDQNSSFAFHELPFEGDFPDVQRSIEFPIIAEEKDPIHEGHKIAAHLDGHVSFAPLEAYPKQGRAIR